MTSKPTPAALAHRRAGALGTALCLAALLAACGGSDDAATPPPPPPPPPPTGSVAVTASLGAVFNGDVSVSCAPTGAALGTGSTGTTGLVTVTTTGSCAGPVLVTVAGRSDGTSTYFDEALGSTVPFPAGSSLRAVAPTFASPMALGVTALTEIATRQALATTGSLAALTSAQASSANSAVVAQVLGAGVTLDILTPPTPWTATTATGSLGTTAADRYAFYLAGLARMGLGAAAPALAVTTALGADLADGTLSGSAAGSTGFVYTAGGLAAQLNAGLNAMAGYANAALQSALGVAVPPALVFSDFSPASGVAGATVTLSGSGFDPDPFHVQVKFASNLVAEVVSSSATAVVVKVPAGAVSGPIEVSNTLRAQTATSSSAFTVTPPAGGGGSGAWVSRASPSGFLLNGLAYGAGRFVAVGFNRTLLTSTDGLRWTAATAPDSNYYETASITWTGSQFVMVGDKVFGSSASALIATSPDGLVWTRRSWTPDACCDVNKLVAVSAGGGKLTVAGAGTLASSSDGGVTWTVDTQPTRTPASTFIRELRGLAGNSSTRVALAVDTAFDGAILVDTGSGWRFVTGITDFSPAGATWTGSQFVAVGAAPASNGAVVMTSPDGVTWTRRALDAGETLPGVPLQAVLAVGSTVYATGSVGSISGSQHMIVQSTDGGATWSIAYQGTATGVQLQLPGMAASPDRVVTVGGGKSVTLP
jgi:IPT/TIG domain